MRVLITGAHGFIGGALTQWLQTHLQIGGRPVDALATVDRDAAGPSGPLSLAGDLADPLIQTRIRAFEPDLVFHLASVPGGAAEADYGAGRHANLVATLALFETLATQRNRPVVVFASSIAVYGTHLPPRVTPDTPLHPPLTYGAHKLACEILLADLSRRGVLDGRSLRLPGIVARPLSREGLASAFMSEVLHALKEDRPYTCPVSEHATAWWMSTMRCVENLVHAAGMRLEGTDPRRAWPLPVLRLSMGEIVQAGEEVFGAPRAHRIAYAPQEPLEAIFGRYPVLDDTMSRALGLRDDGDARSLIRNAVSLP